MCSLAKYAFGSIIAQSLRYSRLKPSVKFCSNRFFSSTSLLSNIRKFSEKHEWVQIDGKIGTIGISHYAQESLGDVVYVHGPEMGQQYERDSEVGVIESVKAVNEIYAPVSGTVVKVNELLQDKPGLVNSSCYDKGWIYQLEMSDPKELDSLMDEDAYEIYVKSIHV